MLAIVIPYFKLSFFKATLDSLAEQIDQRFTLYVFDDASPENPTKLLESYRGRFDFNYHRFEENLGSESLVKQWKRCIALTQNEDWIMILGDDDVLGKGVVEKFYQNLKEIKSIKSSVVRFSTARINEVNNLTSEVYHHPKIEKATDFYYRRYKGLVRSSLSEHIFSRKAYQKFGFREYPLAWHSDDMAWIDFSDSNPVFSIDSSVIYIRVSSLSITGNDQNLGEKKLAEFNFYRDLVYEKLHLFAKQQKLDFLLSFEVIMKKCKKVKLKDWFFLLENYIKIGSSLYFLKCVQRFFKYYIAL